MAASLYAPQGVEMAMESTGCKAVREHSVVDQDHKPALFIGTWVEH